MILFCKQLMCCVCWFCSKWKTVASTQQHNKSSDSVFFRTLKVKTHRSQRSVSASHMYVCENFASRRHARAEGHLMAFYGAASDVKIVLGQTGGVIRTFSGPWGLFRFVEVCSWTKIQVQYCKDVLGVFHFEQTPVQRLVKAIACAHTYIVECVT